MPSSDMNRNRLPGSTRNIKNFYKKFYRNRTQSKSNMKKINILKSYKYTNDINRNM